MRSSKSYYFRWLIIFGLIMIFCTAFPQSKKYQSVFDAIAKSANANQRNFSSLIFLYEHVLFTRDIGKATDLFKGNIEIVKQNTWLQFHKYDKIFDTSHAIFSQINRLFADTIFMDIGKQKYYKTQMQYAVLTSDSEKTVSHLLETSKGDCRTLSYLYKMLADELGVKCWLALAPNHMYIKNHSFRQGWYNTELTSNNFPTDAWIATGGYVSIKAIKTGLYMDTLSNQQSIALLALDLAHAYENQTHNYWDGFIIKCCDLVLKYHAVNPMALLYKAETLKNIYLKQQKAKDKAAPATFAQMQDLYTKLYDLGYQEMPMAMYKKWLANMKQAKKV